MSLVINNNLMAYGAGNSLNSHYASMNTSVQRLSSGLRVMGAKDDAAGLAVREIMRAEVTTLQQGIRNANDGVSLLQTADGALGVIDEKLIRMKELAEQASTGTYDDIQRGIIDDEYQAMASEVTRIANATDFNGIKLLDGNLSGVHDGGTTTATGAVKIHFGTGNDSAEDYYFIEIGDSTASALGVGSGVGLPAPDPTSGLHNLDKVDITAQDDGDSWEINTAGNTVTDAAGAGNGGEFAGILHLMGDINAAAVTAAAADGTEIKVSAQNMHDAWLEHRASPDNAGDTQADFIQLAEDTLGMRPGTLGNWSGETTNGVNTGGAPGDWSEAEVSLTVPPTEAGEREYGKVYDTEVVINAGVTASYADNNPGHSIRTQENAQKALAALDAAIVQKDKTRADIGALQNRLENTVSNLTIQRQNIQAAESRISDVDVTTEMTNFVRNQTLTQAALGMLSQANSMPQMATKLIG